MASKGVTAADFGRTKASQRFSRTRVEADEEELVEPTATSGTSPAAAAFLADLRSEILKPAVVSDRAAAKARLPGVRPASAKASQPALARPEASLPLEQSHQAEQAGQQQQQRTFLSKAERKRQKKQQQQMQLPRSRPASSGASAGGVGGKPVGITKEAWRSARDAEDMLRRSKKKNNKMKRRTSETESGARDDGDDS
jgi:hypothetical protein